MCFYDIYVLFQKTMANLKNKNDLKCRLCLVDSDSKMQDLFSKQEYDNRTGATMGTDEFSKLALYEKVEYCCGLKVCYII